MVNTVVVVVGTQCKCCHIINTLIVRSIKCQEITNDFLKLEVESSKFITQIINGENSRWFIFCSSTDQSTNCFCWLHYLIQIAYFF